MSSDNDGHRNKSRRDEGRPGDEHPGDERPTEEPDNSETRIPRHEEHEEMMWLVRSGGRILGPYGMTELSNLLRGSEIVILDEVAAPLGRWRYIRDEPAFAGIVDEVRGHLLAIREDTEVQSPSQTDTGTLLTDLETRDVPRPPVHSTEEIERGKTAASGNPIVDADFVECPNATAADARFERDGSQRSRLGKSVRLYGLHRTSARSSLGRMKALAWLAALLTMAAVGSIVIGPRMERSGVVGGENLKAFTQTFHEAHQAWRTGEFSSALRLYRKANRLLPDHPDVLVRISVLSMKLEGQTSASKRLLQDVLEEMTKNKTRNLSQRSVHDEALQGLALASLMTEDLSGARSYLNQILKGHPDSTLAHFNSGMAAFLEGDVRKAIRSFEALALRTQDPIHGFAMGRLLLDGASVQAENGPMGFGARKSPANVEKTLMEASATFERVAEKNAAFRQESLVLNAWIKLKLGMRRASLSNIRLALETDPDLTESHRIDPYLYVDPLNWNGLRKFCDDLNRELKDSSSLALRVLCIMKDGDQALAAETMQTALGGLPQDGVLQAVNAYILLTSGREAEAYGALRLAEEEGSSATRLSTLPRILKARLCWRSGDYACARELWETLLKNGSEAPLSALTGLAEIKARNGATGEAMDYLRRALAISAHYRPAMRLSGEMEREPK